MLSTGPPFRGDGNDSCVFLPVPGGQDPKKAIHQSHPYDFITSEKYRREGEETLGP